jgi:hypothetical protein
VGIGTTAPGTTLDVNGIISSQGELRVGNGLRLVYDTGSQTNFIQSGTSAGSYTSADLKFSNIFCATTYMTIRTSGNVGIGTAVPAYTLDVNGSSRFGSLGTAYNSIRSFTTTLSSSFTGVLQSTINYGVTYSNASKLVINVTIKSPDNASDTFGYSIKNVGTTSMYLNIIRLDNTLAPGIAPVAHVTIYELV